MDGPRPHALQAGQGRVHHVGAFGVDVAVKLGERRHGRRVAIFECASRAGQEPPEHTRATEDEIFDLLSGQAVFRCGHARFEVSAGGCVFRAASSTGTRSPTPARPGSS